MLAGLRFRCLFRSLLGTPKHGRWQIAPAQEIKNTTRRYWDNTLILETRFETESGVVALIDFMPPRGKASDVVRLVRGISGRVKIADAIGDPLRLWCGRPLGQEKPRWIGRCWRFAVRT